MAEDEFSQLVEEIKRAYPALAPYEFVIQRGTGEGHLEFYPAWEKHNPNPGRHTIEVRNPNLKGQALKDAIAGDMLHLLGSVDPRSGRAISPEFARLKQQFKATLTPQQLEVDKRVHAQSGDPRPFDQWFDVSRLDAYLRGYLFPDEADEWRRQGVYTPEQQKILQQLQQHLKAAPQPTPAQPQPAQPGQGQPAPRSGLTPLRQVLQQRMSKAPPKIEPWARGETSPALKPPSPQEHERAWQARDDYFRRVREIEAEKGLPSLLQGLQGPLFPLPDAKRLEPTTMTDAQGVYQQLEPGLERGVRVGSAAPGELVTPREAGVFSEVDRIMELILKHPRAMEMPEGG